MVVVRILSSHLAKYPKFFLMVFFFNAFQTDGAVVARQNPSILAVILRAYGNLILI